MDETLQAQLKMTGEFLGSFYITDPGADAPAFDELCAVLTSGTPAELARDFPFGSAEGSEAVFAVLQQALSSESREGLMWEYRRLFVGPGHKAAAPWCSVYIDRDGVIFGKGSLELKQWMLARGLKLPDNSLPVDHFGYELVLMGVLAERNPEDVPEFLETYLLSWAYHLLSLMKGATTSAFYKAIAELTELSLRAIQERLGLTPATLRFYR